MRPRRRIVLLLAIAVCLMVAVTSSHPQSPRMHESTPQEKLEVMRRQQEQRREQMQRQIVQLQERARREQRRAVDESRRQSIGATPSQWRSIRPRLLAVEDLLSEMRARLRPQISYSLSSGSEPVTNCGWIWKPLDDKEPNEPLTAAETTCQTLCDMLADEQTSIEAIWEQVELLRAQRKQAADRLPAAEQALRRGSTLRQEAALMTHGWLQ